MLRVTLRAGDYEEWRIAISCITGCQQGCGAQRSEILAVARLIGTAELPGSGEILRGGRRGAANAAQRGEDKGEMFEFQAL